MRFCPPRMGRGFTVRTRSAACADRMWGHRIAVSRVGTRQTTASHFPRISPGFTTISRHERNLNGIFRCGSGVIAHPRLNRWMTVPANLCLTRRCPLPTAASDPDAVVAPGAFGAGPAISSTGSSAPCTSPAERQSSLRAIEAGRGAVIRAYLVSFLTESLFPARRRWISSTSPKIRFPAASSAA